MRGELTDMHTDAGTNSALSQMTGLVKREKYVQLKNAIQTEIKKAWNEIGLPVPVPQTSQPNAQWLQQSMARLIKEVQNQYDYYQNETDRVRQEGIDNLEEEKQNHTVMV